MTCSIVIRNRRDEEGGGGQTDRRMDGQTNGQTISKLETEFWHQPRADALSNNLCLVEYHFRHSFSWSRMGFEGRRFCPAPRCSVVGVWLFSVSDCFKLKLTHLST